MGTSDRNAGLVALFSFLAGGLLGAGLALLFAPQSGKKTREQIKDLAEDMKDQVVESTGRLKKKIL